MRVLRILIALALLAGVAACESKPKDQYVERPVYELYNGAVNALEQGELSKAASLFQEVERQHPYSIWATKGQLMAAYAQYQGNHYDDAIIGLDRYISLHPGNRDIPYAYYLKALSYYEQISDVSRDQGATEHALQALREVIRRFPDSRYARDAALKLDLTRDHLAGKEMAIGRYYLRRGELLAAINRFRTVVDKYQTTTHVPEALHRLTEAYTELGMKDEARKVAAVLGHNYPGSEWYMDSYALLTGKDVRNNGAEKDRSFLARAWDWVF